MERWRWRFELEGREGGMREGRLSSLFLLLNPVESKVGTQLVFFGIGRLGEWFGCCGVDVAASGIRVQIQ